MYFTNYIDSCYSNDERRGHGSEGEQGGVYDMVWGEEREGRNIIKI